MLNTIFQGTVLGPKLWNVFFQDVSVAAPPDYDEAKFADDLSCFKAFPHETPNPDIELDLKNCEEKLLSWGVQNQVLFDKKKL